MSHISVTISCLFIKKQHNWHGRYCGIVEIVTKKPFVERMLMQDLLVSSTWCGFWDSNHQAVGAWRPVSRSARPPTLSSPRLSWLTCRCCRRCCPASLKAHSKPTVLLSLSAFITTHMPVVWCTKLAADSLNFWPLCHLDAFHVTQTAELGCTGYLSFDPDPGYDLTQTC